MTDWEAVIGLEVHAQLATRSKLFSGASTAYGAPPNRQACAVDLGLPGVLPVLNAEAVRMAVRFGLAVGGRIAPCSVFARKNYFYPDLPKGYQISQYELPVVSGGAVDVELPGGSVRRVGLTRAHLEEDAGKSLHEAYAGMTGVDLNRAGTPLLEIVTEPELRSAEEAAACMRAIHALVRYLRICDGNLQEGSLRCDANVSVRPRGESRLGTRTEIKNLNSFRFLERAVAFEIERQSAVLEGGGRIVQETRLYDPERHETRPMRGKEEAHDYRYFPDPDLLPVEIDEATLEGIRAGMPELPGARRRRFESDYGLAHAEAAALTASRELADYFEATAAAAGGEPRLASTWITGELAGALNRNGIDVEASPVGAEILGGLLRRVADGTVSGKIAKQIFETLWEEGGDADAVIEARGLRQISDEGALEIIVAEVVAAHPEQATQFRGGKEKLLAFFVGQVMKATRGQANPGRVNELLRRQLAG